MEQGKALIITLAAVYRNTAVIIIQGSELIVYKEWEGAKAYEAAWLSSILYRGIFPPCTWFFHPFLRLYWPVNLIYYAPAVWCSQCGGTPSIGNDRTLVSLTFGSSHVSPPIMSCMLGAHWRGVRTVPGQFASIRCCGNRAGIRIVKLSVYVHHRIPRTGWDYCIALNVVCIEITYSGLY